jgi:hypothetical protein
MTQDNQAPLPNDEITQTQQEMDIEQGFSADSQVDEVSQLKVMLQAQTQFNQTLQNQVSGLQGKIDNGLNAIRRDTEAMAAKQIGDFKTELGREQFLASVEDDEERRRLTMILGEIDRRVPQPVLEPQPVATPSPQPINEMERIFQVVEGLGLQRNDPRVNYAALSDVSLTEAQKGQVFLNSIKVAIQQPTASSGQQPQPQSQPQSHAPVDEGRGQPADGNYRTPDALYDAYIQGQITTEEYRKRGSALNL